MDPFEDVEAFLQGEDLDIFDEINPPSQEMEISLLPQNGMEDEDVDMLDEKEKTQVFSDDSETLMPIRDVDLLSQCGNKLPEWNKNRVGMAKLRFRTGEFGLEFNDSYTGKKCYVPFVSKSIVAIIGQSDTCSIVFTFSTFLVTRMCGQLNHENPFAEDSPLKHCVQIQLHLFHLQDMQAVFAFVVQFDHQLKCINPSHLFVSRNIVETEINMMPIQRTDNQNNYMLDNSLMQRKAMVLIKPSEEDESSDKEPLLPSPKTKPPKATFKVPASPTKSKHTQKKQQLHIIKPEHYQYLLPLSFDKMDSSLSELILKLLKEGKLSLHKVTIGLCQTLEKATTKEQIERATKAILVLSSHPQLKVLNLDKVKNYVFKDEKGPKGRQKTQTKSVRNAPKKITVKTKKALTQLEMEKKKVTTPTIYPPTYQNSTVSEFSNLSPQTKHKSLYFDLDTPKESTKEEKSKKGKRKKRSFLRKYFGCIFIR